MNETEYAEHHRTGTRGGSQRTADRLSAVRWFAQNCDRRSCRARRLLAQSGLDAGDDLICEAGPDGLRLTADRLRKVYVEITSACNLACATCIRQTWDEPLGHMPLARYQQLLDGLTDPEPGTRSRKHRRGGANADYAPHARESTVLTLSLSGFGEPLVHPEFLDSRPAGAGAGRAGRGHHQRHAAGCDAGTRAGRPGCGAGHGFDRWRGRGCLRGRARGTARPGVRRVAALVEARRRARRGWRSAWRSWRRGAISAACRGYCAWLPTGNWTSCR